MKTPAWLRDLPRDARIVAVWAEAASGPGWANTPVWVIVSQGGTLTQQCLQPGEQSAIMRALYWPSAHIAGSMMAEVESMRTKGRKRPGKADLT